MRTLTKADLTHRLCDVMGLARADVEKLLELFFENISQTLATGGHMKLSRFGNFQLINKKKRPGRNPKTGDAVPISARRVVTFKAGNKLKELIRNNAANVENEKENKK